MFPLKRTTYKPEVNEGTWSDNYKWFLPTAEMGAWKKLNSDLDRTVTCPIYPSCNSVNTIAGHILWKLS